MTSIVIDDDKQLRLIHETGYWRVLIRPTVFEERRMPSLKHCWETVDAARVSLRGWDYPHINPKEKTAGADWIQSSVSLAGFIEFWRFYQSGQFVHHFSVTEDREPPSLATRNSGPSPVVAGPKHLEYLNGALYTLTEILEFARGLAYRGVLDPSAFIRIELHGMEGRFLSVPAWHMPFVPPHISRIDLIPWERTLHSIELLATADKLAVDAAIDIFERFGWLGPSRMLLEEEQRRLIERRL